MSPKFVVTANWDVEAVDEDEAVARVKEMVIEDGFHPGDVTEVLEVTP